MFSSMFIVMSLAGCPLEPVADATVNDAITIISREAETGTLLFSKGDCLAVRIFTKSPFTHVATIVREEDQITVYDSMNGVGVRKQSLRDYLKNRGGDVLHIYHPSQAFDVQKSNKFKQHLEQKIGTPYAVRHHLSGKRGQGVHCAEYMTDALQACNILKAKNPANVSPGSLFRGVTMYNIYQTGQIIALTSAAPAEDEKGNNRCHQWWIDTKVCTWKCCHKLKGWFFCK